MNKSNIKSKKFYREAERMEIGWGQYLESIDKLKDKVDFGIEITLKEMCWTLYGDGYPSSIWEKFKKYCEIKKLKNRRMLYHCWKGLFTNWYSTLK